MLQAIMALVTLVALPLMVLNLFAGIGGSVWLLVLGEYNPVLVSLALLVLGHFIVSVLLAPSLIFLAPFSANERLAENPVAAILLVVLSNIYTYCIMGLWSVGIFFEFPSFINTSNAILPTILLSYASSTSTWSFLAERDAASGNDYSTLSAFFNQVGCAALMLYTYNHFRHPNWQEMAIWYGAPMTAALVVQVAIVHARSSRRATS